MGSVVSVLVHVALIVLLLLPMAVTGDIREMAQGAGGPGPAGGGGGGTRGTGSMKAELLQFVRLAPPPPPAPAPEVKVVPPPPIPPVTTLPDVSAQKVPETPTLPTGIGGGTGSDNTAGSGPGSGGGVGSGIGTGRGSGVGPGTGGGTQANFPPTPIEMFIPPMPVPQSARGFHLVAEFDVDETGRVRGMTFTETRDRGYNRRLADVLKGFRFRPGTLPDGTPIRMKVQIGIDLP